MKFVRIEGTVESPPLITLMTTALTTLMTTAGREVVLLTTAVCILIGYGGKE